MSTGAHVRFEREDGSCRTFQIYADGYPDCVGPALQTVETPTRALSALAIEDAMYADLGTKRRGRGDYVREVPSADEDAASWADYCYLVLPDGTVFVSGGGVGLRRLP